MTPYSELRERQVVRDNYRRLKEIKHNLLYYLVISLHKYMFLYIY
jgi:hypothetical protein